MFHSTEDPSPSVKDYLPDANVLISQAQKGDEHAFKMIYEHYFDRIHHYLTRMVGKEDIGGELTQETFLRVWRALPDLRQTETFISWLYRIATHIAYDYQRRSRHISLTSYDKEPALIDQSFLEGPEDQVVAEEMLQLTLARITIKYRSCLILYHILGYSKQNIAELLSIQESSVTTYISLGMEEFRRIRHNVQVENGTKVERRKEQ